MDVFNNPTEIRMLGGQVGNEEEQRGRKSSYSGRKSKLYLSGYLPLPAPSPFLELKQKVNTGSFVIFDQMLANRREPLAGYRLVAYGWDSKFSCSDLISVGALEAKGYKVTIENGTMKFTYGAMVILQRVRHHNLYYLKGGTTNEINVVEAYSDTTKL
ncbi:hypothetical protein WN943_006160 [Citrus x changshan-huyou]